MTCKYIVWFLFSWVFCVLICRFSDCQFWRLHLMHISLPTYWNFFWPFPNNKWYFYVNKSSSIFVVISNILNIGHASQSRTISKNEQTESKQTRLVTLIITQRDTQKWYFKCLKICSFLSQKSERQHFSHPMATPIDICSKKSWNIQFC